MSQASGALDASAFKPFAVEWGLVVGAISAAASVFNAVDEAIANRSIQDDLGEIKKYLIDLKQQLDRVEAQNAQILNRLDRLPEQIRQITEEVVEIALLNERYSTLRDIELNIFELGQHRRYRIRQEGWRELSGAITYIEAYENRLSQMFRLIQACELALAATRGRALPLVKRWISDKVGRINPLIDDVSTRIDEDLAALGRLLSNRAYVEEHNLGPDLSDLNQLTWRGQPDRTTTQHYQDEVCRMVHQPCRGPVRACRMVDRTRQVPDTGFHNARDAHLARIQQAVARLKNLLEEYGHLVTVRDRLVAYLQRSGASALSDDAAFSLFYETTKSEASTMSVAGDVQAISEAEDADQRDYFGEASVNPALVQKLADNEAPPPDEGEIVGRFMSLRHDCF